MLLSVSTSKSLGFFPELGFSLILIPCCFHLGASFSVLGLGPGTICNGCMLSTSVDWSRFVGALGDDGDDGAEEMVSFGELAMVKGFRVVDVNGRRMQGNLEIIKKTMRMQG